MPQPALGHRKLLADEFGCTTNRVGVALDRYLEVIGAEPIGSGHYRHYTPEQIEKMRRVLTLVEIFGTHVPEKDVIADWITGEPVEYHHHGYILTVHMTRDTCPQKAS